VVREAGMWKVILAIVLVALAWALVAPRALAQAEQPAQGTASSETGEVVAILEEGMTTVGPVTQPFQRLLVRVTSGERAGSEVEVSVGVRDLNTGGVRYEPGDRVYLSRTVGPDGQEVFFIIDRDRSTPLLVVAFLFVVAILLLGRWKGLRALASLAITFAVLIWILVPRILAGANPVATAIVASFAIFTVTMLLTHGVGKLTAAAIAGTSVSLILTGLLAALFVRAASLTGLASEEAAFLQVVVGGQSINPQGLLLAGMIIGALGVLDDITVSQSSLVFELRRANPLLTGWELFASGVRVGRDHIAATVNTLVLAYAGAALPLLLLFTQLDQPLVQVVNREMVAEEIVRTLVGSLGLISAVPFTTGFASWLAVRTTPEHLPRDGHAHRHH
jgi:uncharacterized membrane protein